MVFEITKSIARCGQVLAGLCLAASCLFAAPAWSAEDRPAREQADQSREAGSLSPIPTSASARASESRIPLVLNATGNGFGFDLGGSDTRKLQLQLDQPLTIDPISLGAGTHAVQYGGGNLLGLDATLNVPLSPTLSLTGGLQRQSEQLRFQSLGSIQCINGVLRADSYTASGCRFIGEPLGGLDQRVLRLGAVHETESTVTAISWFTRDTDYSSPAPGGLNAIDASPIFGADLLTPVAVNPLLPVLPLRQPLNYFDSSATGVDLNFQVGLTTDNAGDIRLGLALTHIMDADFSGLYTGASPLGWTISDPFNTARMNLEWNRGPFTGGVQGFYREQVDFLNRESLDSLATFDVYFTWRTPWNADLSVGTSSIINAGSDDTPAAESQPADPFESIYGPIPYVRYKQDL